MITVDPNSHDAGQPAIRVTTPSATYFYHTVGGGFSSILDRDGNDWIGYRPGDGPAGQYRGIPNMVFRRETDRNNHFHPGHDGPRSSHTSLVSEGPDHVTIESWTDDRWRVRWHIEPSHATMTVLAVDPDDPGYWFLYEGTPGGRFTTKDRCLRADGPDRRLSRKWESTTAEVPWVAFRVPALDRSLVLAIDSPHDVPVSYYPMEPMTVFGFGRRLGSAENLLETPGVAVSVRLVETADPAEVSSLAAEHPPRS